MKRFAKITINWDKYLILPLEVLPILDSAQLYKKRDHCSSALEPIEGDDGQLDIEIIDERAFAVEQAEKEQGEAAKRYEKWYNDETKKTRQLEAEKKALEEKIANMGICPQKETVTITNHGQEPFDVTI